MSPIPAADAPRTPAPQVPPGSGGARTSRLGSALFWLGAASIFVGAWLVMWWIAPFWRSTPPADLEGTVWAFGGLVFMTIALSVPLGMVLAIAGTALSSGMGRGRATALVGTAVLFGAATMFPSTLGYYPVMFGIAGGVITVSFVATVWSWARRRRRLEGAEATAADFQLVGYVSFFFAATLMCSLLGNPYGGLFDPVRVLNDAAMPWYYAMGSKVALFLALGWSCLAFAQYKTARSD